MIQIDSSSLIIHEACVYGLLVKEQYCPGSLSWHPCDFCELHNDVCVCDPQLCTVLGATPEEFYVRCGIVVVDQQTHTALLQPFEPYQFI